MATPRHTSRGIVIHDGHLLLIERWRPGKHYYSIPGGGIEAGESAEQTVVRELLEETSCVVTVRRQLYTLRTGASQHTIFLCQYVSGEPHLPADSPEARDTSANNRFEPTWLPLAEVAQGTFYVWQPIQRRLLHDLAHGFSSRPVDITARPRR